MSWRIPNFIRRLIKGSALNATDHDHNMDEMQACLEDIHAKAAQIPTGSISQYLGTTAPYGWYLLNGATITQSDDPNLYGFVFNEGLFQNGGFVDNQDGSFNLPDLRGAVLQMPTNDQQPGTINGANSKDHAHGHSLQTPDLTHSHPTLTQDIGAEGSGLNVVVSVDQAPLPAQSVEGTIDSASIDVQQKAFLVNFIIKR